MRIGRHRGRWLGILALCALVLVPLFLHGHDHGHHGPSTSAPCAACTTSHQSVMHATAPALPPAPRLVAHLLPAAPGTERAWVDRTARVGRGPPAIVAVAS